MFRKITIYYLFIIAAVCMFSACEKRTPITVSFYDVSGAYSPDHTIKILFAEEKNYEEYYVDLLISSDTDVVLTLFQEFSDKKITLNLEKGKKISLDEYKLFNLEIEQTDSMVGYGDVLATTIVINSNKNAKISLLAVIGEKEDNEFKKVGVVSKEFSLNVIGKTI